MDYKQPNKFFLLAKEYQGAQNQAWRYFITVMFFLFTWLILGSLVVSLFLNLLGFSIEQNLESTLTNISKQRPFLTYFLFNLNFILGLISLLVCVKFLHKRALQTLVTWKKQIDYLKILVSFLIYSLFCTTGAIFMFFLKNGEYKQNPYINFEQWLLFVPLAFVVTGCQILLEELFFRGYLIQWFSLKIKQEYLVVFLTSLIFAFLHLTNPENALGWLVSLHYFFISLFLTLLVQKDQSLELAIGSHLANNLFGVLILSYTQGALSSATGLILVENIRWTWIESLFNLLGFSLLYLIFLKFLPKIKLFNSKN